LSGGASHHERRVPKCFDRDSAGFVVGNVVATGEVADQTIFFQSSGISQAAADRSPLA
jgi:hypothetical protein